MKSRAIVWATLLGIAVKAACSQAAETLPTVPSSETNSPGVIQSVLEASSSLSGRTNQNPVKLSSGLEDIVRMVQSGTSTDVILSFVENSPVAYSPGADDIIELHRLGVPSPVVVAVLRHGSKLRDEQLQAAQTNRVAAMTTAEWYALPTTTNSTLFATPNFPVYTFTYPVWWFASYPGFWFGYLWPYYNCGFYPGNSWRYVAPINRAYPQGTWGYYSRTVNEPRAGLGYVPGPSPGYSARPAPPPVATPPPGYGTAPPSRSGVTQPASPAPRGRGR